MRIKKGLASLAVLGLVAGAAIVPATISAQDAPRIVVVTHGQAADAFWSVVKNGVDAAAKDMGVSVDYALQEKFDLVKMGQDIDAAVASNPDGLVVSIPDVDAVGPNIKAAVEAGIPVISINSGSDVYKDLGVLVHIGQTEYEAGVGGGERMAAAGAKNAICFNQEVGNVALDLRCQGFTDAFTKAGGKVQLATGEISDPTAMANSVLAAIQSDPTINSVMTLGPSASTPILNALKDQGKIPGIMMGTFDLSPEVLTALTNGEMLFAIDQQQYLQGYLPIVFLKEYITHGLIPGGGGVVLTGPGFVTKDNAAQVIDLSTQGIR